MCTVCMCSIFATTHEPNWTCCKHSDQNLYNTSNARCKLNYIKYKYELVSQMEDGTISHASSSSNDACSVRRETCVCVWVCAKIANKADERHVPRRCCTSKSHFSLRTTCVCVCGPTGRHWIHTDRPTNGSICKDCIYDVNVKYDMPGALQKKKRRYYAHKIFILCFRIYQFDVCAVYSVVRVVRSRLICVRFTLSHFCSFYFNNFPLAFIVSRHQRVCIYTRIF